MAASWHVCFGTTLLVPAELCGCAAHHSLDSEFEHDICDLFEFEFDFGFTGQSFETRIVVTVDECQSEPMSCALTNA